jgi:predicted RNase H-like nuclease (RuvC/YqgF family)
VQHYDTHQKYIDAVEFWKTRNEEARAQIHELEQQNMKLEERIGRFSKDVNVNKRNERESSVLSTTSNKRSYDQRLGTPSNRATKKAKREVYSLDADGTLVEDVEVLNNTEAGE